MSRYKPAESPSSQPALTGVLLVNLGTPEQPTASAVRRYLGQFLQDPRVVELPRALWWLILHGFILRFRPPRVAKVYQSIWQAEGSPLLSFSKKLTAAVAAKFSGNIRVELAMCYGEPGIVSVLNKLRQQNLQRLLVIPMYPQYSATTSASVFDAVTREMQTWRVVPEVRFCMQYYQHPQYIQALAASIQQEFAQHGKPQKLLFSFHGIPQRCATQGDPYPEHCSATAQAVAKVLGLAQHEWQLTYQSRFGREPWLMPYTDHTLKAFPSQGITSVQIVAPGFAVDCLETLEELAIQNREIFEHAGGKSLHYIPALNDRESHRDFLVTLIQTHLQGWV